MIFNFSEILNHNFPNLIYQNATLFLNGNVDIKLNYDIKVEELKIVVNSGEISLVEFNPSYSQIDIVVNASSSLKHSSIYSDKFSSNNVKINVENSGFYNRILIDLSVDSLNINTNINLVADGSESDYKSATISYDQNIKRHTITTNNLSRYSKGNILNYGIVYGDAILDITGIGDIKKGASVSESHQKTVIVTFDEKSKGYARPFLYIAEDDVKASHDTAVGKIDEEIIFYLTSRGVSEKEAKRFIALGYFKPIIKELNDDDTQQKIIDYLEGVIK